jgi:DUF1365 family protein
MSGSWIFSGDVTHVRHAPFRHRFTYRVWMLSLDVDALDEVPSRLFRHNARGLVSLQDRDHGPRDGTPLRPWVEAELARAGLSGCAAMIRFMFIPRVLGYALNPIAFFFCHDMDGRLRAVIHQVKDTWGGQHAYVLPVPEDAQGGAIHQYARKAMYISPFFDTEGGYRFSFAPPRHEPGGRFLLTVRYGLADTPRLTSTLRLRARPLATGTLVRALLAVPLMPMKVIAAIHWEALRLWLKGARIQPDTSLPAHAKLRAEERA